MIAPTPARIVGLQHRFADAVDVLVDACQFRIAATDRRRGEPGTDRSCR
jgi:hypothetical protein